MAPCVGTGVGIGFRSPVSGPPAVPPPQSPAIFYDFTDPGSMSLTGNSLNSITDKIGGLVATSTASQPVFFPSAVANGGPIARTRFDATLAQGINVPLGMSINRQAVSIFAISRKAVKADVGSGARGSLFISSDTAVRTALFQWDQDELRTWDGTATSVATGIVAAHGTSVEWLTSGAANVQVGSGNAIWSQGTPLAANTSTAGRIGLWTVTNFPLAGDFLGLLVYNRQLNSTERDGVLTWARTRYGAPPPTASTAVFYSGDSLTEGIQQQNPQVLPHSRDFSYPAQIERISGATFRYWNGGLGGQALVNNLPATQIASRLSTTAWPTATKRVVFGLWGTNDISGARTEAEIVADIATWITNVRAAIPGVRVGHGTILARSSFNPGQNTIRSGVNDYIMARGAYTGAGAALDFRIDTAAISTLTNPLDTTKFINDGTHLTSSGYGDLAAGIWTGGLSAEI